MKMIKKISKVLGGLLLALLLTTQVFGAAVTINITGITDHTSGSFNGYIQVIQSSDASRGAPGTDGLPAGDTVLSSGTVTGGNFSSGAAVPSSQYIYLRAWENWNGTGNPAAGDYYGHAVAENVGAGFIYTYNPAAFQTSIQFGASTLNITTTSLPGGTQGSAYSQSVTATGGTAPYTWSISAGSLPAGLSMSSAGAISGTPTGTGTSNFTVQCSDSAAGSDTQALSINVTTGGGTGLTVTPASAYVGQTIIVTGSGFGAAPGTITVGGVAANPTAWSDTSVTCAVPSGATSGNVAIGADTGAITIATGGVVIDDFEGGSVGNYAAGMVNSGYYAYGTGITPDSSTISGDGPQASAASHGSRGMNVMYSYVSDWGGGWGAAVSNTLDISAYSADTLTFYVNWDGSSNIVKLSLKDTNDVIYAATVTNTSLNQTGYHPVQVNGTSFVWDIDDPGNVAGTLDWSQIVSYGFSYPSQGTSANYQNIDSFYAGTVTFPDGPIIPTLEGDVIITQTDPVAGPAGTKFTAIGSGFGITQGQSLLIFENNETHTTYQCDVISWSDTSIEAIVPRLAPKGGYTLKVIRIAVAQGTIQAYESNPAGFEVTSGSSSTGSATIYPNPFSPNSTNPSHNVTTIAYDATGVTNIGIYIYDMTARLVYHQITNAGQTTWDGTDMGGSNVSDGLYILRVVNEENKSLISKGKILVIKQ
jgi:Putative Ig domain/IPT/TIG domain/Carbohydrate binding domain (family 11)